MDEIDDIWWYLGEIDDIIDVSLVILIDDDINFDDISDEIWVKFGWYLDEIDDIINGWYWWWH